MSRGRTISKRLAQLETKWSPPGKEQVIRVQFIQANNHSVVGMIEIKIPVTRRGWKKER